MEDCRKLADGLQWEVAEEYIDNDVSAFSGKRRPAYERMLADLVDGFRDAVLVYHPDRLTRRPLELEKFLEVIGKAGVAQVRFAAGGSLDMGTGDGLLVLRMMAAVAANESETKSRRLRRKHEQIAAEGRPGGGSVRPFGFESDRVTVIPVEAEVVRQIVARFLTGESVLSIARWLEEEGVRTVTGKTWRTTSVRTMLASARIAGLRAHRGRWSARRCGRRSSPRLIGIGCWPGWSSSRRRGDGRPAGICCQACCGAGSATTGCTRRPARSPAGTYARTGRIMAGVAG